MVTWVFVIAVLAGYVWFVVWRVRVDRRKKADARETDDRLTAALARLGVPPAAPAATDDVAPEPVAAVSARPEPALVMPAPAAKPAPADATVVSSLQGIKLPHELVPLTTMTARESAGDRIAFWTDAASAEAVGPEFAAELERLGYEVRPLDEHTLSAERDDIVLTAMIHRISQHEIAGTMFPSVPPGAVVVEVWLPR